MKATEQYFPVVLFIMLFKLFLSKSADKIRKRDYSNKWKCGAVYYAVRFLIQSMKILHVMCDHSLKATEQYSPVLTIHYAVQGGSNFWVSGWNPKV